MCVCLCLDASTCLLHVFDVTNSSVNTVRASAWMCDCTCTFWCACVYVLCVAGGDRSSVGSSGSVTSVRSSGSGQSAGSAAHILHAQAEGVKVTHTRTHNVTLL